MYLASFRSMGLGPPAHTLCAFAFSQIVVKMEVLAQNSLGHQNLLEYFNDFENSTFKLFGFLKQIQLEIYLFFLQPKTSRYKSNDTNIQLIEKSG